MQLLKENTQIWASKTVAGKIWILVTWSSFWLQNVRFIYSCGFTLQLQLYFPFHMAVHMPQRTNYTGIFFPPLPGVQTNLLKSCCSVWSSLVIPLRISWISNHNFAYLSSYQIANNKAEPFKFFNIL